MELFQLKKALRVLLFTLLPVAYAFQADAQDLIVTEDDSLNVLISQLNEDNIIYIHNGRGEVIERSKVLSISQDFFKSTTNDRATKTFDDTKSQRFRMGFHAGYSYRLASISEDIPDELHGYFKRLKSGFHLGIDASVLFPKFFNLAIGFQYSLFSASSALPNGAIFYDDTMGSVIGQVNEINYVHFIAPTLGIVAHSNNKSAHYRFAVAFGYVNYISKGTLLYNYTLTSNTWAFQFEMNPDFRIYRNLYGQIRISLFHGILRDFNYSLDGTGYSTEINLLGGESLMRMDFSTGLLFYF